MSIKELNLTTILDNTHYLGNEKAILCSSLLVKKSSGADPRYSKWGPDKCLLRARGSGVSPLPPRKFWNLGPGMGDFQHLISRDNCRLFHAFYTISNFSYFKNTFCPLKFCIGNYTLHLTQGIKNRDVFISIFTLAQENRQNICLSNVSWKVTEKKRISVFRKPVEMLRNSHHYYDCN